MRAPSDYSGAQRLVVRPRRVIVAVARLEQALHRLEARVLAARRTGGNP